MIKIICSKVCDTQLLTAKYLNEAKYKDPIAYWITDHQHPRHKYSELYNNLKGVLNNPENLKNQADRGTAWAKKNCSYSFSSDYLSKVITDL